MHDISKSSISLGETAEHSRQKEMHLQKVPASSSSNSRHVSWMWGQGENIVENWTRKLENPDF